jgi:hypothetical protein
MKKLVLTMMIAAGSLMHNAADAQVGVSVGLNIGPLSVQIHKPVYDDFYYLPDVEAYYSVPEHVYYYMDGDDWVCNQYLPGAYRNYDWRNVPHYEVRAQRPYMNHETYRSRFGGYGAGRMDWNRGRHDGGYAYNGPQRGNFPHSPYDSNNAGRGGYYGQPDRNRGGYDGRDNGGRGNWNNNGFGGNYGQRNDNGNRGQGGFGRPDNGDRGQGSNYGGNRGNWNQGGNDNRNQGGSYGNQGGFERPSNGGQWQGQGGNGQQQGNGNRGQGNYGQPSNNQQNRGNWNQGGGNQQRLTQNNENDNRPRFNGRRMMF